MCCWEYVKAGSDGTLITGTRDYLIPLVKSWDAALAAVDRSDDTSRLIFEFSSPMGGGLRAWAVGSTSFFGTPRGRGDVWVLQEGARQISRFLRDVGEVSALVGLPDERAVATALNDSIKVTEFCRRESSGSTSVFQ